MSLQILRKRKSYQGVLTLTNQISDWQKQSNFSNQQLILFYNVIHWLYLDWGSYYLARIALGHSATYPSTFFLPPDVIFHVNILNDVDFLFPLLRYFYRFPVILIWGFVFCGFSIFENTSDYYSANTQQNYTGKYCWNRATTSSLRFQEPFSIF